MVGPSRLVLEKNILDLVYIHPGGVRTAMDLFFFEKVQLWNTLPWIFPYCSVSLQHSVQIYRNPMQTQKDIMAALECAVERSSERALLSIVDTIDFLKQQRTQFSCQEMIQSSRGRMLIFNIYNTYMESFLKLINPTIGIRNSSGDISEKSSQRSTDDKRLDFRCNFKF